MPKDSQLDHKVYLKLLEATQSGKLDWDDRDRNLYYVDLNGVRIAIRNLVAILLEGDKLMVSQDQVATLHRAIQRALESKQEKESIEWRTRVISALETL